MAKKSDILAGATAAACMALLILDSKTALIGAKNGLDLCIQTVIPSLFPFFILSILLCRTLVGRKMRIFRPLSWIFRIPDGAETLLLAGILGGYPVGAQCVSQAYEQGQLSHRDARRMLAFCSNCGPAFLFGMIGSIFDEWWAPWALWAIHLISAMVTSFFIPSERNHVSFRRSKSNVTVQQALNRAVRIMASVCGWVVLFRVVIQFLQRWLLWMLPSEAQVVICGILELSNGCLELSRIENTGLRFILCAGFLSFGGLCVTMQTYSVISQELDRRLYFPGKVMQCCISLLLAGIICGEFKWAAFFWIPCLIGTICVIALRKMQNNSSISQPIGV